MLLAEVDLARARDLLLGISHEFIPLRQPSRSARNSKQHSKHVRLESHRLVDDARVKIDVGIELAGYKVVVAQSNAFEFECNVDLGIAARNFEHLVGDFFDNARPRIVVLVDTVPEAH